MNEVYDYLKKCGTFYLATMDGDQPRVRPFGAVDLFEDKIYLITGKTKDVSKQIQKNSKVEISAFDGNEWIRLAGKVVRDDRVEAKQHMLETNPNLKSMYSADDENMEVLYFKCGTATFASFTAAPRTVKL